MVAPYGKNIDNLYRAVSLLPTKRLYLIKLSQKVEEECRNELGKEEFGKTLIGFEKLQLHVIEREIKNNLWEEAFMLIAELKELEKGEQLLVNVSSADERCRCAFTCASYVNDLRAFEVINGKVGLLPTFRFSFTRLLTDKKLNILKLISKSDAAGISLLQLAEAAGMSLPLTYYHINGNSRVEGLQQLGLVEVSEEKQGTAAHLTLPGKLVVEGLIKAEINN